MLEPHHLQRLLVTPLPDLAEEGQNHHYTHHEEPNIQQGLGLDSEVESFVVSLLHLLFELFHGCLRDGYQRGVSEVFDGSQVEKVVGILKLDGAWDVGVDQEFSPQKQQILGVGLNNFSELELIEIQLGEWGLTAVQIHLIVEVCSDGRKVVSDGTVSIQLQYLVQILRGSLLDVNNLVGINCQREGFIPLGQSKHQILPDCRILLHKCLLLYEHRLAQDCRYLRLRQLIRIAEPRILRHL